MKIIDRKYKDYYDFVQRYGQSHVVYKRSQEQYSILPRNKCQKNNQYHLAEDDIGLDLDIFKYKTLDYSIYLLGFCGKIYPGVQTTKNQKFIYSEEDFIRALSKSDLFYFNKKQYYNYDINSQNISSFFDIKENLDLFIKVNSPIFIITGNFINIKLQTNPLLKYYDFQKIFEPFSAFQNIEQFIGNFLIKTEEPSTISNINRIHKHGFDKYSFRNQKRK